MSKYDDKQSCGLVPSSVQSNACVASSNTACENPALRTHCDKMNDLDNLIDELWLEMKSKIKERPEKELSVLQTLKGMEELGEIADLVLRESGAKRKHKDISDEELKKRLGEEIADAMLVLLLLSKNKNIDINKHLKEKIGIEIERWKAEDKHK